MIIVCCYKILYIISRIVNAFAEENATEDAVYYLGEALRKGVIDLDVFLKVKILILSFTLLLNVTIE